MRNKRRYYNFFLLAEQPKSTNVLRHEKSTRACRFNFFRYIGLSYARMKNKRFLYLVWSRSYGETLASTSVYNGVFFSSAPAASPADQHRLPALDQERPGPGRVLQGRELSVTFISISYDSCLMFPLSSSSSLAAYSGPLQE